MSVEANQQLISEVVDEVWNGHNGPAVGRPDAERTA